MFPRKNRLKNDWEIRRVFKRGKRIKSPLFSLFSFKNKKADSQATIIVSKKYDKRAVERNKLKRKFREAAHFLVINLPEPHDLIILPNASAKDSHFNEIKTALEKAFTKIFDKLN